MLWILRVDVHGTDCSPYKPDGDGYYVLMYMVQTVVPTNKPDGDGYYVLRYMVQTVVIAFFSLNA